MRSGFIASVFALGVVGCGGGDSPFSLRFAAVVDGKDVGCTDALTGFGPQGAHRVGVNDLRFYVSDLRFTDAAGATISHSLDASPFQYSSSAGSVALVDLTGTADGTCTTTAFAGAEGTARTNFAVTGATRVADVAGVSFSVGVPQPLMKQTIATTTPEGAPSPLNEMYWSWNSGYRHLVFNFAISENGGATGEGYVHVGSRDCAPAGDGAKALSDREACTFVNTPRVELAGFALATDTVALDLRKLLAGLSFSAPILDPTTHEPIGEGLGVACHSAPSQADCAPIFGGLGLDMNTGSASASLDKAFGKK